MRTTSRILLAVALLAGAAGAPAQTSPWSSGTYLYDGAGNIKRIGADYYIYDQAGRLIEGSADKERTGGNSFQTYTYDMYGNRTTASTFGTGCIGGCGAFLDINEYNHVRTSSHGASYDGGGNLTQFDTYQYSYDAAQMMTRLRLPNTTLDNQYIYSADDERLATYIAPGQWRFTVRDLDGKVLREVTASEGSPTLWSWDRDHVFRDGLLLATALPSGLVQHYHLDHLGTPKLVTGNTGTKLGVHAYYPFGEELSLGLGEVAAERLQFTGHERDLNGPYSNAVDYMHARYYSPTSGRFSSVDKDPANGSDPQSWNRYAYVRNKPTVFTDPTGRYLCAGTQKQCDEFERERKKNILSTRASQAVKDASNAYGNPNTDNGVTVKFGSVEDGKDATATIQMNGMHDTGRRDDNKNPIYETRAEVEVTIGPSLRAGTSAYQAAVAHEGSHVLDGQKFAASFSKDGSHWSNALDLNGRATEINAYRVTADVANLTNSTFQFDGGTFSPLMAPVQIDRVTSSILQQSYKPHYLTNSAMNWGLISPP